MAEYEKKVAKERAKVLLTGRSQKLIGEVEGYLREECRIERCQAKGDIIARTLKKMKPDIMVICLNNENNDIYKNYGSLITDMEWMELPVVVTGEEEECFDFQCKLPIDKLETISIPLNQTIFLDKFHSLAQRSMKKMPWEDPDKNDGFSDDEFDIYGENENIYDYGREATEVITAAGEVKKCILVVDDDVQMLNTIKLYLEDLYNVIVVPSGKLALKYLEKKKADFVLLDYMMPDMDGPSVLKEIRKNPSASKIPVVFLTGVSDKDDVMRGLDLRPNSYLLKPVSREVLRERIISILSGLS